jgi:predicted nucleic acid-binding protein
LHKLSSTAVSVDSSVVVDFHLSNSIAVLTELFVGRVLLSDFVDQELAAASISLPGAEIVAISSEEDWNFLDEIRRKRPGLGLGELGAITVARSRGATLLANDKLARQTAEEWRIPVAGAIGILEYAVELERLSGREAVDILEAMIWAGAWMSDDLVDMFKRMVLEGQ